MRELWDTLIDRAGELASKRSESAGLLNFYRDLLIAQKNIYDRLRSRREWLPTGELRRDLGVVRSTLPTLLDAVEASGSDQLAEESRGLRRAAEAEIDGMLLEYWAGPKDAHFFAKALLQPYARWLAETGAKPVDRDLERAENRCPFCAGKPQLSVLKIQEPTSEAGGRNLLCSTCLTSWAFKRVICASCGEEHPAKLAYFTAPEYDYVRVEACDTCACYIKGIDLTRFGLAAPLVDEVASAPLDLWAREHGYAKIELNLVGI
ncbi:MAG TPA: formate dehydrogenase accessory protein FdhE [Blastocatellia bacterium]|nr:formate dehydrogenase accessory protein FdhE [Blastocatellia bacterium]